MSDRKDREPESTPYGPHPRGIDEASGGADSSPFEDLPSGEKGPAAEREKAAGRLDPKPSVDDDRSP
ncbi:MAG TPA: hypothetical protein VM597_17420 [Gemmataceae bacterium]|jgi:hypothetical protein|nr:hypothetical protein [Gemmataceae bacterium]